jgi:hypothetical protein
MALPITAGCDAAWIWTSYCSDASFTEIQCLRPLPHSRAQIHWRPLLICTVKEDTKCYWKFQINVDLTVHYCKDNSNVLLPFMSPTITLAWFRTFNPFLTLGIFYKNVCRLNGLSSKLLKAIYEKLGLSRTHTHFALWRSQVTQESLEGKGCPGHSVCNSVISSHEFWESNLKLHTVVTDKLDIHFPLSKPFLYFQHSYKLFYEVLVLAL